MSVVSPVPPPQSSTTWGRVTQSDLRKRTMVIAVLASVSAIITTVGPHLLFFAPEVWVPGVAFGSVLAFALYQGGIRDKFHLGFVVLLTIGTWYAANLAGNNTHTMLYGIIKAPGSDIGVSDVWVVSHKDGFVTTTTFLVGGFVGGLGTFLQTAFVAKSLRRMDICLKMAAGGAICALAAFLPTEFVGFFPLYLIWQVSMAVMVVRGLGEAPGFQKT